MKREYAKYHVGLKIILRKGNEFLLLTDAKSGLFDLPGGRIDDVEHKLPLAEILAREIREEIGKEVKYKLNKPVFQFRVFIDSLNIHNFLTVYEAEYLSGDIQLSF
jgi:8-oxo-dGTP pyrophosphatase MutT (NUDIX family)